MRKSDMQSLLWPKQDDQAGKNTNAKATSMSYLCEGKRNIRIKQLKAM